MSLEATGQEFELNGSQKCPLVLEKDMVFDTTDSMGDQGHMTREVKREGMLVLF